MKISDPFNNKVINIGQSIKVGHISPKKDQKSFRHSNIKLGTNSINAPAEPSIVTKQFIRKYDPKHQWLIRGQTGNDHKLQKSSQDQRNQESQTDLRITESRRPMFSQEQSF